MSDDAERARNSEGLDSSTIRALFEDWYHLPVLAVAFAFMVWVRQRSWSNFVSDGTVYLGGNDPWYHLRQVTYTVEHYPSTMPFDPWTNFPLGTNSGQFGTLFDQIIATAAMIVGLGDPTTQQIATVTALAPVVIGSLIVIPVYLIASRLGGRLAGVLATLVYALLPGLILSRSLVGTADHNIAEPLFMSMAVFALLVAIGTGVREKPVWEQIQGRELDSLRTVLGYSTLAGIVTALFLYVWPPGILLIGVFGFFVLIKMTSDVVDGDSPEHLAIPSAIAMGVTAVLLLVPFDDVTFSATGFTLLQVLMPLAVAVGAAFLAWLAREWDRRDIEPWYYPGAVVGILAIGTAVVRLVLPNLYNLVTSNLLRFVGFTVNASYRTIGEAQPFPLSMAQQYGLSQTEVLFHEYGFTFFLAFAMLALLVLEPLVRTRDTKKIILGVTLAAVTGLFLGLPVIPGAIGGLFGVDPTIVGIAVVGSLLAAAFVVGTYDAERLLVVVWTVFMLAAAFTQVRFNYYLAVPVAVLSAYLPVYVMDWFDWRPTLADFRQVDLNAILAVAIVAMVLIVPLAVPVGLTNDQGQTLEKRTVWDVGANTGPGSVTYWDDSLSWMQDNTPAEGNYGGAGNADALEYYGTYEQPADGDFDYPEGSYGVMSWWDYGHWITVLGERIPVANPFQQHATTAANYLIAPSEADANAVLEDLDEDDAKTRYVAVDWQMMNGKFNAPVTFYDAGNVSPRDFQRNIYQVNQDNGGVRQAATLRTQRYYESQMVRLYAFHGSAVDPAPVVVDWDVQTVNTANGPVQIRTVPEDGKLVRQDFDSLADARQFVENDTTAQIGGFSNLPEERVDALEHYRQVKVNAVEGASAQNYPAVKLFERVPGATVQGTGPANSTVTASVEMAVPSRNTTFTYKQYAETGADGTFEMTLPYSSTGYENWGVEEGYTNVSIRATGPYTFSTGYSAEENMTIVRYADTANVTEGQVIGEDDSPVTVELERQVVSQPEGATNSTNTTENQTALAPADLDTLDSETDAPA